MAGTASPISDPSHLSTGERIDVHSWDAILCKGLVEEVMPKLRVVWVRDLRTGERKMFCTDEHQIRRPMRTRPPMSR